MSREESGDIMLKSKGILYFPPVKDFTEAMKIYTECGGMILSLEEDGYLVEEPIKIAKLYDIPVNQLELYFKDTLNRSGVDEIEISKIIEQWLIEENIKNLEI